MRLTWPTSVRVVAVACVAWLCFAASTASLAQSPPVALPATGDGYVDSAQIVAAAPTSQQPTNSDLNRAAVEQIVRETLQAEKSRIESAAVAQPTTQSFEVGKDRAMTARWDNGFHAESADKSFRIHLGGRLEFDNCWFNEDGNLLIGVSPDQRMRDGTLLRRARFRADGRLWEFTDFACEVNFANIQDVSNVDNDPVQVGSVGLTDFYITFREFPVLGNLRVGHLQAPISLERYTSSNAWYYMERSSMFDAFYNPNDYQNGMVAFDSYLDDRVTLAGSAAWIGKADVQSFGFGANEGKYGVGARATCLPVYEDEGRTLFHLGTGYFHQALVDHRFSIASRPLLRAGGGGTQTPNLIFTGTFFTPDGADIANVEAALVRGPFSMSGEYAVTHVTNVFEQATPDFAGPRGDATYQAFYLEGGWFVTPGDYRRYDKKTGTWTRTTPVENAYIARPDCGPIFSRGAIQLLARYTYLDLVSGSPVLTPTSGGARAGIQSDVTLGVNWYLNSQASIMINYVATDINSVVPGASGMIHGIGCRFHLDF